MATTGETNDRLKKAVNSVAVPPFLEARIRNALRSPKVTRWWLTGIVSAAAAALGAVVIAYQLGHLRMTVQAQESYIASVSDQVPTLMRVGLGDHIHCAVFRTYPKNGPTVEELVKEMNPAYAGLIPIVRSQVPSTFRLTMAHQCAYRDRKFVHLSLMDDSNLLSLLITRKAAGESFRTEQMLPALAESGIPMYRSSVQRFQIMAFETRDYLVYFVSDLGQQQNTDLMLALGARVKDFLGKLEV
jgi:hypothetical protein